MKFWNVAIPLFWGGALLAGAIGLVFQASAQRVALNFNPDWKFSLSDPEGAQTPAWNDSRWVEVSLPHGYTATFDDSPTNGIREKQNEAGGSAWYRKTFTLPPSFQGKHFYIEFEAVRPAAEVYLNGKLVGASQTSFIPFGFDLTPYVQFGKTNVLAVRCGNLLPKDELGSQASASGAISARGLSAEGGIYRNVRLYVIDPLHISLPLYSFLQTAGPYVYANEISPESARINVEVPIENSRRTGEKVELVAQVLDRNGVAALTMRHEVDVVAAASAKFNLSGILPKPEFWESSYPYLYRVVCALKVNGQTVDNTEIPLGIRTVNWTKDKGFFINGQHEKLHGWAQKSTDEWPGLGAAQPDWMHFYTLNLMKEAGGNWVRWIGGAAGPEMISACDQLGLMVEQPGSNEGLGSIGNDWKLRSAAFRDLIIYYRNNPAILIWEGADEKLEREQAAELHAYFAEYDPHGGRAYASSGGDEPVGEFKKVFIGAEGSWGLKNLPVVEGGYDHEESQRGIWDKIAPAAIRATKVRPENSLTSEEYAVNQAAQYLEKIGMPEHSGGANWIFSDATGNGTGRVEAGQHSGEVDGVRLPKEAYYVCRVMYDSRDPQVHIIGHWTYPAGTKKMIYVASNCERVELFVNGKSLGFGTAIANSTNIFTFKDVVWEPGEIRAVAMNERRIAAIHSMRTAGPAAALRMSARANPNGGWRADGLDILLIDVEALDAKGERCPNFQQRVFFELKGEGIWPGASQGEKNNSSNQPTLELESGINRLAVRATRTAGKITLKATCPGLKPASLTVKSAPFRTENGFATDLPVMPSVSLPSMRLDGLERKPTSY